jgi:hypothetical protein
MDHENRGAVSLRRRKLKSRKIFPERLPVMPDYPNFCTDT